MALERFIKRYTSITSAIDTLRRKELPLLDPQNWDDRNDRHFMMLYKEHIKAEGLYAACFTQAPETYHHWRVFSGANHGACIEIYRQEFEDHISGDATIRKEPVTYMLIEEIERLTRRDMHRLPFLKRVGFEPEEEYRVMATSDQPQAPAIGLPIDLALIHRIYVNPWLPDTLYQSIKETLSEIDGCDHIEIRRSALINSQRWKNAGNKIAGKPASKKFVLKLKKPVFTPKPPPKNKKPTKKVLKRAKPAK